MSEYVLQPVNPDEKFNEDSQFMYTSIITMSTLTKEQVKVLGESQLININSVVNQLDSTKRQITLFQEQLVDLQAIKTDIENQISLSNNKVNL